MARPKLTMALSDRCILASLGTEKKTEDSLEFSAVTEVVESTGKVKFKLTATSLYTGKKQ